VDGAAAASAGADETQLDYYKRLGKQAAKLHARIGNLRREFLHQETSCLVETWAMLATEELRPSNMSRSVRGTKDKPGRRVKQKAGLHREILSAGLSTAHLVLAHRVHVCKHCGHTAPRDRNAASVMLIEAHTPGTGVAARPKPLSRQRAKSKSVARETPATVSKDA
jgi:putative transposase